MKSPWKFISNLTSRRRAEETSPEEEQVPAAASKALLSQPPASESAEEVDAPQPIAAADDLPVETSPVEDIIPEAAQDDNAGDTETQEDTQGQIPADAGTPVSDEAMTIVDRVEEPVEANPPPEAQKIAVLEAPVSAAGLKADKRELPTPLVSNEPAPAAVQNAAVVRTPRKQIKRPPTLSADEQLRTEMQAIDEAIKELRRALAEKLIEQNAQLRSLIDRY
jgi:hypothetical protein